MWLNLISCRASENEQQTPLTFSEIRKIEMQNKVDPPGLCWYLLTIATCVVFKIATDASS